MYVPKAPSLGGNTLMKLGKPGPDGLLPPYSYPAELHKR